MTLDEGGEKAEVIVERGGALKVGRGGGMCESVGGAKLRFV